MRIGIDASNLKRGGGLTHLSTLWRTRIRGTRISTASSFGVRGPLSSGWLRDRGSRRRIVPSLKVRPRHRFSGDAASFPALAKAECDLLFAPGGLCTDQFHPVVTMPHNMLPFQWREAVRYGPSAMLGRLALLRRLQQRSFRTADGVIFLSQFAQDTVLRTTGPLPGRTTVIPHGVAESFFQPPRRQRSLSDYSAERPMRILYVSIVDVYKHQWQVAEAVAQLRCEGVPIAIEFVGDSYPKAGRRLRDTLRRLDPQQAFLTLREAAEHAALPQRYHTADLFVFASSCENLPNILLEAMAAGLPIASSSRGPMPEILGEGGLFFDPLEPESIAESLRRLADDAGLRGRLAAGAYARAGEFSWEQCADRRFGSWARFWKRADDRRVY